MISVGPAGQMWASQASICGENVNVAVFSNTINMMHVKLFTMVILAELYPFIPLSETFLHFRVKLF